MKTFLGLKCSNRIWLLLQRRAGALRSGLHRFGAAPCKQCTIAAATIGERFTEYFLTLLSNCGSMSYEYLRFFGMQLAYMYLMNAVLQNLLKLQALEFGEVAGKNVESQTATLRGQIPQPILGHYDRLRARDKKGVALVRNQVCTGCHMLQPIGKITIVMRGEDVQLCDSCGRYLFLEEESGKAPEEPVAEKPAAKPARKAPKTPRKRKTRDLATAA